MLYDEEEDLELGVIVPEYSETIYFYAVLGKPPEIGAEEFYLKLLTANFLCYETNGTTLAYDKERKVIVLCYTYAIKDLDQLRFENMLAGFIETAKKWKDNLFASENNKEKSPFDTSSSHLLGIKV